MTDRLHLVAAAIALLLAALVGPRAQHQHQRPADPSLDPSTAVPYHQEGR